MFCVSELALGYIHPAQVQNHKLCSSAPVCQCKSTSPAPGFGAQWVRQRRRKGSTLRSTSESLQSTKTKRVRIEKTTEKRRNFKGQGTGCRSKIQCKSGRKGRIEKNSGKEAKAKEPRKREQFQNAMHALQRRFAARIGSR